MNRPRVFEPDALQRWAGRGFHLATPADESYPPNLRTIDNRPPFVFIQGALTPADQRAVAIVGTRRPSPQGLARTRRLAHELAQHGITVVSGLAAGIDTAAHQAALAAGGRTIGVLGTGLARCYPAENRALQALIPDHGALISQFSPETPPSPQTFP
ncbi:MAG TPA: DNA-processing protein DprA, partial [Candidatus Xenobia bacterium]